MSVKIAIMSMKGGQGKTVLSFNLADRISKAKQSVLLIDSDMQANVTTIFQRDHVCNLANLILGEVKEFQFLEINKRFSILPSGGKKMMDAARYINNSRFRETVLQNLLQPLNHNLIIIDCAPSWNEVNENILMYVDYVIIPVVTDYLGYSGCDQVMTYLHDLKGEAQGLCRAEILGIAVTRYNNRTNISKTVLHALKNRWLDLIFDSLIEDTVSIQEAPAFHQSIFDYKNGKTRGAQMYEDLCKEILTRVKKKQKSTS